jgi:hypothetical protein
MSRKNQELAGAVLLLASNILFPHAAATAQTIVHSFDGDRGPGLAVCETGVTHCGLPEMDVAANGKEVVQVTWQNVRIYDYNGRLLQSTPMSTFIRNAGLNPIPPERRPTTPSAPGPFEPHVVYDEFINRWIVTITCLNDCMLVSASADPAGKWGGVYLSCGQGGPCLNFDPALHIGFDKNGVYYCGAHIADDNPHTIPGYAYDCFAAPNAEVKAIARGSPPAHVNRAHNMPLDIMPAIDHNRSKPAGAPAFFSAKTCERATVGACQNSTGYSFSWLVETFTWKGVSGTYNPGGEQVVKTDVGSTRNKWFYSKPCCGPMATLGQAGNDTIGLRAAESHRLTNLVQFGSHLYGVMGSGACTASCGSQGTDTTNVMFWFDMDCSKPTACVVSQTAKISGENFNPTFATVGVDKAGNVGIVAESSSSATDLSVLLWTHRKTDAPNTFNGPTTIVSGTQPYTCLNTNNFASIGNAAGILTALDPADGAKLWTSQQWSNDAARCVWKTRIVQYQIAGGR